MSYVNTNPEEVNKGSILQEAETLITGQRQVDYGDKRENFQRIADGWNMVLKHKMKPGIDISITPEDVALCMMQLKIARLCVSNSHRDSLLDIAGYVGCYDDIHKSI